MSRWSPWIFSSESQRLRLFKSVGEGRYKCFIWSSGKNQGMYYSITINTKFGTSFDKLKSILGFWQDSSTIFQHATFLEWRFILGSKVKVIIWLKFENSNIMNFCNNFKWRWFNIWEVYSFWHYLSLFKILYPVTLTVKFDLHLKNFNICYDYYDVRGI